MGTSPTAYRPPSGSYSTIPAAGNPANTEAWALIEAARRILEAAGKPDEVETLKDALRLNWRLWTIFQANLTLEDSGVPDDLRSNMLSLCSFVDKRTVAALIEPTLEKVQVLVDVNRNIASGLLAGVERASTVAAQAAQVAAADASPPASGSALKIQSA